MLSFAIDPGVTGFCDAHNTFHSLERFLLAIFSCVLRLRWVAVFGLLTIIHLHDRGKRSSAPPAGVSGAVPKGFLVQLPRIRISGGWDRNTSLEEDGTAAGLQDTSGHSPNRQERRQWSLSPRFALW